MTALEQAKATVASDYRAEFEELAALSAEDLQASLARKARLLGLDAETLTWAVDAVRADMRQGVASC